MKIGMLIKDYDNLKNWELRIVDKIRNNQSLELCLLIKDGRIQNNSFTSKIKSALKSKNLIAKFLFKIQTVIESKAFKKNFSVNRVEVIKFLNEITCIKLNPKRKGFVDLFNDQDAEIVKEYDLDIILRHEFNIIRGEILNASKYGIWSFHHGDNSINRGGPPGFWEIILKQSTVGVTLQQLTPELDGGLVIDKGFYNRHWSHYLNDNNIHEHSVDILFKNIKKLEQNQLSLKKSTLYFNPLYKNPPVSIILKYLVSFYSNAGLKLIKIFFQKFFGVRYSCWTLFIGKGNFIESTLYRLKPVDLPKNEFWADPFLFQHNNEVYVFFENFSYKNNKGKISCGKINDGKVTEVMDVLDLEYHLSYPFIFSEDDIIYMIPESSEAKRVEIYKCIKFPNKWELFSTAFEGETIVDTTYFRDELGQRWLFHNKGFNDNCSNLYIYKIDSLKFDNVQSHSRNPVIIDSRVARGGGAIFKYEDKHIRPSQNNSNGVYGYGLNLNVIKKLSLHEYEEETLISVEPNFCIGLEGTHHLHQLNDRFVIDGSYKRK